MKVIRKFGEFNGRRYGNPWVAIVNKRTARIDFNKDVGGYTGIYNAGDAGELYITNPVKGGVYAYGQKDYRGGNSFVAYVKYIDGEFIEIEKSDLIKALRGVSYRSSLYTRHRVNRK